MTNNLAEVAARKVGASFADVERSEVSEGNTGCMRLWMTDIASLLAFGSRRKSNLGKMSMPLPHNLVQRCILMLDCMLTTLYRLNLGCTVPVVMDNMRSSLFYLVVPLREEEPNIGLPSSPGTTKFRVDCIS